MVVRDFCIELEQNLTPQIKEGKIKKFSKIFNDVFVEDLDNISNNIYEIEKYFEKRLGL